MCGAVVGGLDVEGLDVSKETVIQGLVHQSAGPTPTGVPGAYVRLLDASGEFTAEVQTSDSGGFRFFAAPGDWTLRVLSSLGKAEQQVNAKLGVTNVTVEL